MPAAESGAGAIMKEREHTWVESREEMEAILAGNGLGFLGLVDDGKPYVIPLNYSYHEGGRILFHCALVGKKLDLIRQNPNVTLTVARQLQPVQRHEFRNPCHLDSESVVCSGTAWIFDDPAKRRGLLNAFNHFFRPTGPKSEEITEQQARNCMVVEIRVHEMTGRREQSRQRTYWRWRFGGTADTGQ
jgi:nitroimidazol reductase NimA-like FMN-containing flavoprotein (pyridoxamine 5'-phosphate oxidase superfamily)